MATTTDKYIEGIGRRKTAVARVRITPSSKGSVAVNEKTFEEYFLTKDLQRVAEEALKVSEVDSAFDITVHVNGGGIQAQAESVRHGLSRALVEYNPELRGVLKKAGFLKRDPRSKERKKFGLKKARKRAQWSKR